MAFSKTAAGDVSVHVQNTQPEALGVLQYLCHVLDSEIDRLVQLRKTKEVDRGCSEPLRLTESLIERIRNYGGENDGKNIENFLIYSIAEICTGPDLTEPAYGGIQFVKGRSLDYAKAIMFLDTIIHGVRSSAPMPFEVHHVQHLFSGLKKHFIDEGEMAGTRDLIRAEENCRIGWCEPE